MNLDLIGVCLQEKESISGVQWRKENLNPRVLHSSGKLGEPHFPLERMDPRVVIFLSPLTTHDGFYLYYQLNRDRPIFIGELFV